MTNEIQHLSSARMNEAVDGVLAASAMEEIERHVQQCTPCREEYARLSEVVRAVRALPRAGAPPEDAWTAIAARIAAPGLERETTAETPVIDLGSRGGPHRTGSDRGRRKDGGGTGESTRTAGSAGHSAGSTEHTAGSSSRSARQRIGSGIYLSLTQLAAAAAIVAVVSATIVWVGMNGGNVSPATVEASLPASGGAAARAVSLETGRYAEAVTALEAILDEGRGVLDPETLFTIEESLRAVDEAIADVEQALDDDPNSALLLRLLANQQRTKLGVLQRAADAVHAQT